MRQAFEFDSPDLRLPDSTESSKVIPRALVITHYLAGQHGRHILYGKT